ncbi:MAG TPA: NAD-dependent epimerase/dehydratase family protein [Gaiellaceae bacterium]|jgi:nucleoside-diphosphate-sugar epimerase|nr:NAD-dependent epimerase/dehydratase family protein [Gaiellaceae bacterium]
MRVVVVGATGNVGTSVLDALADEPQVESVLGLARRVPEVELPKVEWARADVTRDELVPHFRGADCVVHLAWKIQPSRDSASLRATNVHGSARVFLAAAEAKVPALVYASSVGAYSPGPKDRRVDESWPTGGIPSSFYSRHKSEVERILDRLEQEQPPTRVVRLRPGLIFKREAATGIRRLFAGPFLPSPLLHPRLLPLVPDLPRLRFQAVHSRDVGEAYRLAISGDARGAFNVAAEPVLDPQELARLLRARPVRVPEGLVRGAAALSWRLHLQPTPPGWLDLALNVPLLDVTRARDELGWAPRHTAGEALLELLAGMRAGAGAKTPPLDPAESGPARVRELAGGVGSRE